MSDYDKLRDKLNLQVKYYDDIIDAVSVELEDLKNVHIKRYRFLEENLPSWANEKIKYLIDNKIITKEENPNLEFSDTELKYYVALARTIELLKK